MENQDHYCQDRGDGNCIICGAPMPKKEVEKDHYCQDRGDGNCIICGAPMPK